MNRKDPRLTAGGMTRQIYYADVKMNKELFSNEWDKKLLLNALEEAQELLRVEVYAFCVLDDRLRVLAGGTDVRTRTVRRLVNAALEQFERQAELIGEKDAIPAGTQIRANILRMEDEKDVLAVLRYIHLSPLTEGYTISAQDYWWTSYSTYRGHYNWTLLKIAPVMRYLLRYDQRPVQALAEHHRRGEALRNPIPSCIRRGEFEPIQTEDTCIPQGNINETFLVHA
jgi:hypothetical protein